MFAYTPRTDLKRRVNDELRRFMRNNYDELDADLVLKLYPTIEDVCVKDKDNIRNLVMEVQLDDEDFTFYLWYVENFNRKSKSLSDFDRQLKAEHIRHYERLTRQIRGHCQKIEKAVIELQNEKAGENEEEPDVEYVEMPPAHRVIIDLTEEDELQGEHQKSVHPAKRGREVEDEDTAKTPRTAEAPPTPATPPLVAPSVESTEEEVWPEKSWDCEMDEEQEGVETRMFLRSDTNRRRDDKTDLAEFVNEVTRQCYNHPRPIHIPRLMGPLLIDCAPFENRDESMRCSLWEHGETSPFLVRLAAEVSPQEVRSLYLSKKNDNQQVVVVCRTSEELGKFHDVLRGMQAQNRFVVVHDGRGKIAIVKRTSFVHIESNMYLLTQM